MKWLLLDSYLDLIQGCFFVWCYSVQIKIDMFTDLPVQVDGEPWKQPAGQVVVIRSALKASYV